MPELPEVETIVNQLIPLVDGNTLLAVKVYEPRCIDGNLADFTAALKNKKILRLFRRGKYICFSFPDNSHLTIHLRMTGKVLQKPGKKDKKYLRAKLVFPGKGSLYFVDVRKFGRMKWWPPGQTLLPGLGAEPLDSQKVFAVLKSLKTTRFIKTVLLDQEVLAGVGNIYADEALFRSGIHPQARFFEIDETGLRRLSRELPLLLDQAIKNKGTTLSDYRTPDDEKGNHQDFLKVYGRENQPCGLCGTPIKRIVINNRSSHFCPQCQP